VGVSDKRDEGKYVLTTSPFLKPRPSAYCGSISTVSRELSGEVELKWANDEADTMPVHPTYAESFLPFNPGDDAIAVRSTATCCGR